MPLHTLTQLQYSEDRRGPWRMYIYDLNGEYHRGGTWFQEKPQYQDEGELNILLAYAATKSAFDSGREIRICDGGDMLVFHAKSNRILFGDKFWEDIGCASLVS
jgi:hypothetical protein